jgi:hypothetical protein
MHDVLSEKLTLVSLNISVFSGFRRATRENIAALGGSLPQSKAITEGSIKIFPCDGTKALLSVRRSLFRKLQSAGIGSLGSKNVFAVLADELPEIEREISRARSMFDASRNDLYSNYDQIFEAHVQDNIEAEKIIRSMKVGRDEAVARCRFSTDVFRIAPFVREGQSNEEGVEGIVQGLGRKLYEELSEDMASLLKHEAFATRRRVGQKTLRPLKAQIEKLKKFIFLDPSVDGAIQLMNETLGQLPLEGYVEDQQFLMLEKLIEVMSDPDTLLNAASRVKNGIATCDVLFPPLQAAATPSPIEEPVDLGIVVSEACMQAKPDPELEPEPELAPEPPLGLSDISGLPPVRDRSGKAVFFF